MNILGLSYGYHDSAACVVRDGVPIAAAEEERFSRLKHDTRFPERAIAYCLREAGIVAKDLDAIAFYEKPARKLERALQIAKQYAPASTANIAASFPELIIGGMCVEEICRERLGFRGPVYFSEHHLSHAASAFYLSPFEEATILTVDGVGEWATCAQFIGNRASIEKLREIHYPHSLGLLYSTLTAFLGFKVNDDEYKIMGLASYGKPRFRSEFEKLIELHADGSFTLSLPYFGYMYDGDKMYSAEMEKLFGKARRPNEPIEECHRDIAASLQAVTEDAMVVMARSCLGNQSSGNPNANLCLAGGVAYNCVANSKVVEHGGFERVFIQPAAGDNGAALGAALWASHEVLGAPRHPVEYNTLLGPGFGEEEILERLNAFDTQFVRLDEDALCKCVAALIHKNLIVGWFQGRMEFGPRALGCRSILANPCSPDMKDILNARVKFREEFRPFAPAVIEEAAATYFEMNGRSPYMLLTPRVRPERAVEIPSVTHVDGTARVQTVSATQQPLFHRLIKSFAELSGVPILINTSFNIRGEPIVCTPDDAIKCFMGTDIDFLAIGSFLVTKVMM
jgi:carbamoyltransferase